MSKSNWDKDEVRDAFDVCSELVGVPIRNDALAVDFEDDIWFVAGYDGVIYACMPMEAHVTPIDWELFARGFANRSEQVPADLLL